MFVLLLLFIFITFLCLFPSSRTLIRLMYQPSLSHSLSPPISLFLTVVLSFIASLTHQLCCFFLSCRSKPTMVAWGWLLHAGNLHTFQHRSGSNLFHSKAKSFFRFPYIKFKIGFLFYFFSLSFFSLLPHNNAGASQAGIFTLSTSQQRKAQKTWILQSLETATP